MNEHENIHAAHAHGAAECGRHHHRRGFTPERGHGRGRHPHDREHEYERGFRAGFAAAHRHG